MQILMNAHFNECTFLSVLEPHCSSLEKIQHICANPCPPKLKRPTEIAINPKRGVLYHVGIIGALANWW